MQLATFLRRPAVVSIATVPSRVRLEPARRGTPALGMRRRRLLAGLGLGPDPDARILSGRRQAVAAAR
jgi:hypothetical protein